MELHAALASGGTHLKHYEHACFGSTQSDKLQGHYVIYFTSSNLQSHISAYIPNGVNSLCEVSRVHDFQRDSTQRK